MEAQKEQEEQQNYEQIYEDPYQCRICRTKMIDRSATPNYGMCRECRERYVHYPIPKPLMGAMIALAACILLSYGVFVMEIAGLSESFGASKKAEDGYVWSTLNALDEQAQENPDSLDLVWRMMEIAMDHQYYDYAAYIANTYLTGKEVSDNKYAKWEMWKNKLDNYYLTNDKIQEAVDSIETIEDLTVAQETLRGLAEEGIYDQALIYYTIASMEMTAGGRKENLEKAISYSDDYTYMYAELADICRREGDIERAEELLDFAYGRDKEMPVTLRAMAILELLQGDAGKGLELARQAYELGPDEVYVVDTYIVSLALNGEKETAESVKKEWEDNGYTFDEDTIQCMNGEITLEEYYMDEGGKNS